MQEYWEQFELLLGPLSKLTKAMLEINFSKGLKQEVRFELRLLCLRGLGEIMDLAQMIEEKNESLKQRKRDVGGSSY